MLSLLLNGIRNGNLDFGSVIAEILAVLVIIFLILPFHEWAHAFTASLLGDKAVKGRGRLSINPLSHIDPMGALCMLLFGFGWAKPVPIDPRNFKNPKVGMAITAIMGPIANIVAAFVGLLIYYPIILFTGAFPLSQQSNRKWLLRAVRDASVSRQRTDLGPCVRNDDGVGYCAVGTWQHIQFRAVPKSFQRMNGKGQSKSV